MIINSIAALYGVVHWSALENCSSRIESRCTTMRTSVVKPAQSFIDFQASLVDRVTASYTRTLALLVATSIAAPGDEASYSPEHPPSIRIFIFIDFYARLHVSVILPQLSRRKSVLLTLGRQLRNSYSSGPRRVMVATKTELIARGRRF